LSVSCKKDKINLTAKPIFSYICIRKQDPVAQLDRASRFGREGFIPDSYRGIPDSRKKLIVIRPDFIKLLVL